jgi:aldose 1-epimerase
MQPSGRQIEITFEDQTAVITEVGATLRCYDQGGVAVVEGFAPEQMPDACRNQVCYPWVNRVGSGEWNYSGRLAMVGADNVVTATLNHGVARWRPFAIDALGIHHCTLSLVLHPLPEYPFVTKFSVTYSLSAKGLSVTSTVENLDEVDVPFSLGYHPYVAVTTPTIDGARLTVPARSYVAIDSRMLPTGETIEVQGSDLDFSEARLVDDVALDVTYGDLLRDESGMFTASLRDANGHVVQVSQDGAFPFFQVFSADTLAPERRRTSLALEPMTAPADALRTGRGLISLAPSETWIGAWRVRRIS